jgi:hypothetical protein
LACLCAAFASPGAGSGQSPGLPKPQAAPQDLSARPEALPDAGKGEASLPPNASQDWWSKVQQDIQQQEYSVTWSDQTPLPGVKGAWQAPNRAQGFRTYFTEKGIRLIPRTEEAPSWTWGLELARWGREGAWKEASAAEPRAEANRVTLDRPGITEWYLNDERGLEQGFTIPAAPDSKLSPVSSQLSSDGSVISTQHSALSTRHSLFLDLALTGTLRPVISKDGQAVDFYGDGNYNVLRYAQLVVTDATGQLLPTRFVGFCSSQIRNPKP